MNKIENYYNFLVFHFNYNQNEGSHYLYRRRNQRKQQNHNFPFQGKKIKFSKIIFLRNKQHWKLISYSRFSLHLQSKWVVMQPIQKQNPSKHWKFTFFFHLGQKTNFKVSLLQKWINWKSISYSWSSLHYNQNEGYHNIYRRKPAKTIKSHFFHFMAKL